MKVSVGTNALDVAAGMAAHTTATLAKVQTVTVMHGALLEQTVKRNASGRPGPNVISGDYYRSITRSTNRTATGITARVSTNKGQAKRLEMGFHGTDSLGRNWDQKAYPHFGPALDRVRPLLEAAIAAALKGTP